MSYFVIGSYIFMRVDNNNNNKKGREKKVTTEIFLSLILRREIEISQLRLMDSQVM